MLTGAYAGIRPGELFGLEVNRLDMLRRQLKVVEALTEVSGRVRLGPPKSKASKRTVTMPEFLVDELAQHLAQYRDPDGWLGSSRRSSPAHQLPSPVLDAGCACVGG